MGELIRKDNNQYRKYEDLLLKRDLLYKEAGSIRTAYLKEFGALLLESLELKIECIKKKKMIGFCHAAINRGEMIDVQTMNHEITKSMRHYNMQLKQMIRNKEISEKARTTPVYRIEKVKRIYRRLAKKLHPDLSPGVRENEELIELWDRIVFAYHNNDDEELENLEIIVRKKLEDNGDIVNSIEISSLEDRILSLEHEINDIITTEPYAYMDLLASETQIKAKKKSLNKEIDEYKKYKEELTKILNEVLSEGGATLTWVQI